MSRGTGNTDQNALSTFWYVPVSCVGSHSASFVQWTSDHSSGSGIPLVSCSSKSGKDENNRSASPSVSNQRGFQPLFPNWLIIDWRGLSYIIALTAVTHFVLFTCFLYQKLNTQSMKISLLTYLFIQCYKHWLQYYLCIYGDINIKTQKRKKYWCQFLRLSV